MQTVRISLTILALAIFCSACSTAQQNWFGQLLNSSPPVEKAPADMLHTVQYSGETLSGIAEWYTGNVANWKKIQVANDSLDPGRIQIGQKIRIPAELLVKNTPLPATSIARPLSTSSPDAPQQESIEEAILEAVELAATPEVDSSTSETIQIAPSQIDGEVEVVSITVAEEVDTAPTEDEQRQQLIEELFR